MSHILRSVSIKHFRSFFEKQTINFAIPNGQAGSGLTVITGPNGSGKTSFIKALTLAATPAPLTIESADKHDGHDVVIEIEINTKDQDTKQYRKKILKTNGSYEARHAEGQQYSPDSDNLCVVPSGRFWNPEGPNDRMDAARQKTNERSLGFEKNVLDPHFIQRLQEIHSRPESKDKFNQVTRSIFPQFNDWDIYPFKGQVYFRYKTHRGEQHPSNWAGGFNAVAKVLSYLFVAADQGHDHETVIIDEPENSLHPQAQKKLLGLIAQITLERQVVLITHSPYFIDWSYLKHGSRLVRFDKNDQDATIVGELLPETSNNIASLLEDWQKPQLLDEVAKSAVFGDHILFVEGQEDVSLLNKEFSECADGMHFEIFGYGVGGVTNIITFLSFAHELNLKAAAIFDGDDAGRTAKKKCEEKFGDQFMLVELPTQDIREKEGFTVTRADGQSKVNQAKTGMFNNSGQLKKEHEPYLSQLVLDLNSYFTTANSRA